MSIRKFSSGITFLTGLVFLLTALLLFANAIAAPRVESRQLVEESKFTLILSLTLLFGLGWLWSSLAEYLAKRSYLKSAIFISVAPALISLIYLFTTQFALSFWNLAIYACGTIFFSSQLLRFSVIHLDELALKFMLGNCSK
jgi:hypothetical protein